MWVIVREFMIMLFFEGVSDDAVTFCDGSFRGGTFSSADAVLAFFFKLVTAAIFPAERREAFGGSAADSWLEL